MRSVGQLGPLNEETAVTAWIARSDHDAVMSCVYRVIVTGMTVPT
jgi:hypothetical protein